MRYVLKISYDGTAYAGWQRQKNALSVQETLENAVKAALGLDVRVMASGRTDAGVHALGQVCQFDADCTVPAEKMPDCLNRQLPIDVRVLAGSSGTVDFDCNRNAKRKTYRYSLYVSGRDMPLKDRYATRIESASNIETLQACARLFEGEHDFKAFCASGSSVKTTVRTVYEVRVEERLDLGVRSIDVYVTGNGFLYNMVRTMIGELLLLADGKHTKENLQAAFDTGDRGLLGKTMPAKGLTLMQVEYEKD